MSDWSRNFWQQCGKLPPQIVRAEVWKNVVQVVTRESGNVPGSSVCVRPLEAGLPRSTPLTLWSADTRACRQPVGVVEHSCRTADAPLSGVRLEAPSSLTTGLSCRYPSTTVGGRVHRLSGNVRGRSTRLRGPARLRLHVLLQRDRIVVPVSCELYTSVTVPRRAADVIGRQASGRESSSRK